MVISNAALPRIGLGMAALGRPGYINLDRSAILGSVTDDAPDVRNVEVMQKRADEVMDRVVKEASSESSSGSSIAPSKPWFDCARSYGLSEKFVGEYLRKKGIKPDDVHVSSKWGYTYVADWKVELGEGEPPHEVKDHSVENFLKQVEETSTHIGEYVDLYQVHSATFESGILTDARVHDALAKCRKERGWAIGLSVSGPNQDDILREAMKIRVDGDGNDEQQRLFDSVQCTYNVLEQRPGPALLEAREAGMDIIIKEGMANGRVLRNVKFTAIAEKFDIASDQLALGCILAQDFCPRVLSGGVTPEQLSSNYGAAQVAEFLRDTEEGKAVLAEVMEACRMESEQYWKDRSALAWN